MVLGLCCVKVIWLDPSSFPLTYAERRVIDDVRFSVVRPSPRQWNLKVRHVRPSDTGPYRCLLNTDPVTSKLVMLYVKGDVVRQYNEVAYILHVKGMNFFNFKHKFQGMIFGYDVPFHNSP